MDKEKIKHWGKILIFAAIFIFLILFMEWLNHLMKSADPPWTGFWPLVVRIVKIIGEGGVVACIIGVIIEISHFRRFYETIIRRFLTEDEYLEKFSASTLDEIFERCYYVRNKKEITNAVHKWKDQFDFAWKDLKDIPTRPYRINYIHTIDYKFYSKGQKLPEHPKFSESGVDLEKLNQDFVLIEDTIEYDLVSPYLDKEYPHNVFTREVLTPFKENPNINIKNCLIYELKINGEPVKLKEGDGYSVNELEGEVEYSLDYDLNLSPSMNIFLASYSVEPQAEIENFYSFNVGEGILDKLEVYFRSNVDLKNLSMLPYFPNFEPKKLREVDPTPKSLTFIYNRWIFPGAGFFIVWER